MFKNSSSSKKLDSFLAKGLPNDLWPYILGFLPFRQWLTKFFLLSWTVNKSLNRYLEQRNKEYQEAEDKCVCRYKDYEFDTEVLKGYSYCLFLDKNILLFKDLEVQIEKLFRFLKYMGHDDVEKGCQKFMQWGFQHHLKLFVRQLSKRTDMQWDAFEVVSNYFSNCRDNFALDLLENQSIDSKDYESIVIEFSNKLDDLREKKYFQRLKDPKFRHNIFRRVCRPYEVNCMKFKDLREEAYFNILLEDTCFFNGNREACTAFIFRIMTILQLDKYDFLRHKVLSFPKRLRRHSKRILTEWVERLSRADLYNLEDPHYKEQVFSLVCWKYDPFMVCILGLRYLLAVAVVTLPWTAVFHVIPLKVTYICCLLMPALLLMSLLFFILFKNHDVKSRLRIASPLCKSMILVILFAVVLGILLFIRWQPLLPLFMHLKWMIGSMNLQWFVFSIFFVSILLSLWGIALLNQCYILKFEAPIETLGVWSLMDTCSQHPSFSEAYNNMLGFSPLMDGNSCAESSTAPCPEQRW